MTVPPDDRRRVIVIGAGLTGLAAALLLALDGHQVTVVERDPEEPPAEPGSAWSRWRRPGVRQFRLPHTMAPRWWQILRRELPEVAEQLLALGGEPINLLDQAAWPDSVRGGRRPGDERFDTVAARRPALEAALALVAKRTAGLRVRRGAAVGALTAVPGPSRVPRVTGVVTRAGETLPADLVVDAGGRGSAILRLLRAIGAPEPVEERRPDGFVYYCRHFRVRDTWPAFRGMLNYPGVSVTSGPGEAGTWAATFVTSTRDRDLGALRKPDVWGRAAALYPDVAPLASGTPITGVEVMAMRDRYRRFVVAGRPVATGLVVIGDAGSCTNPALGRGGSLGLMQACLLRDVLREVSPSEPDKLVRRFDEETETITTPWVRWSLSTDDHRLGELRAAFSGTPYQPDDPHWSFGRRLSAAALNDPALLRARMEVSTLLRPQDEAYADPVLRERIARVPPTRPPSVPGRDDLLAALARQPNPVPHL